MKMMATLSFMAFANTYGCIVVDILDSHRQTDICAGGSYHFTGRGQVIGFVVLNPSLFKKKSDYVVFEHVFHCLVLSISDLPILQHIVQMIDQWANMALLCTLISSKSTHVRTSNNLVL